MNRSAFLSLRNLSKRFSPKEPPVLEKIDANIVEGQITGLIGSDGAGKTTLMRLVTALLVPTTGSVTLQGKDSIKEAPYFHENIGYMPQRFGLYEELTVMQNLKLYADLQGVTGEEQKKAFDHLLQFTGLAPFTDRMARALSGGMKQKLGLACVLVRKPALLLLDEPTVGVDPISRRELWNIALDLLKEGITILWSTSYLDEAEKCHSVLLLHKGQLIYEGAPKKFAGHKSFHQAFLDALGGAPPDKPTLADQMKKVTEQEKNPVVAHQLTKRFDSFVAVDQISFSVHRGEIFGLLGPNGAGKSTTFKMLCGLLKPSSGHASIHGLDFQSAPSLARSKIGYMAQKFSLYGRLTLKQNLEFFSCLYRADPLVVKRIIELFHFTPYLSNLAESLPLGLKQRLSLACATMHQPSVLFLDEPTAGVDPKMRLEFWNHIESLQKKGVTILVTTHFMQEAEYCDRIALIHQGKLVRLDSPSALKKSTKSKSLEEAFIKAIEEFEDEHQKN